MLDYQVVQVGGFYKVQYPKKVVRRGHLPNTWTTTYNMELTLGSYTTEAAAQKVLDKLRGQPF